MSITNILQWLKQVICVLCKIEIETFQFVALTKVTHVDVNKCQVHNCD